MFLAMASDPGSNNYGPNPQNPGRGARPLQFDPQTGERLSPAPRFDPQTGQPLPPPSDPPAEALRAQRDAQRPSAGSAPTCS